MKKRLKKIKLLAPPDGGGIDPDPPVPPEY